MGARGHGTPRVIQLLPRDHIRGVPYDKMPYNPQAGSARGKGEGNDGGLHNTKWRKCGEGSPDAGGGLRHHVAPGISAAVGLDAAGRALRATRSI